MTQPPNLAAEIRTIADGADAHDVHDRLHQLADRAERAEPVTAELEAIHGGLEPEQECRAEALRAATKLLLHPERPLVPAREVASFAAVLADWIRTGSRP